MAMKRNVSLALILCLLLSLLPATATAAGTHTPGKILMAYNPSTDTALMDGSFTCEEQDSAGDRAGLASAEDDAPAFLCGTPDMETELPLSVECTDGAALASVTRYEIGDRKTIYDSYREDTIEMECVATGEHCTVWASVSDPVETRLPADAAVKIAEGFDERFDRMIQVFGDYLDADGDGKVALLCYDIGNNYALQTDPIAGGYFYWQNMLDAKGKLFTGSKTFTYPDYYYRAHRFGMDCVHITTSNKTPYDFSDEKIIKRVVNTTTHEFQHLINYSWAVFHAESREDIVGMEGSMNEWMSSASVWFLGGEEHMISEAKGYNNISNYPSGSGVFNTEYVDYRTGTLLIEYMRTRYAQLYDPSDDGSGIFRKIQEVRVQNLSRSNDTFGLVAEELFHMDKSELLKNMWLALYFREDKGPLGFNGEAWSKEIRPYIYDSPGSGDSGIQNGGVRFYRLGTDDFKLLDSQNLEFEILNEAVYRSGTCGPDATWTLTLDNHLYIDGSGEMEDYTQEEPSPWNEYRTRIKAVTVEEGITSLGERAFMYCSGMREIQLPATLTSMGSLSLFGCSALTQLTIPDAVTELPWQGMGACKALKEVSLPPEIKILPFCLFTSCSSLEKIEIPDGVEKIEMYAFFNCNSLKHIVLPASVTTVDKGAFNGCTGLTDVYYTGTKDQWEAMTVGEENSALTETAKVHYRYDPTACEIKSVKKTAKGVTATVLCRVEGGTVLCAAYAEDGRMTAVQSSAAVKNPKAQNYQFSLDKEACDSVKIFLLDGQSRPLCEGKWME